MPDLQNDFEFEHGDWAEIDKKIDRCQSAMNRELNRRHLLVSKARGGDIEAQRILYSEHKFKFVYVNKLKERENNGKVN